MQPTVNSCLADTSLLPTPPLLWTTAEVPKNKKLLKTTPAITDSLYYRNPILVPIVSSTLRVDCTVYIQDCVLDYSL